VGLLTSLTFILTIGDPTRFARKRDVGAFLGLVPRRDQSGETEDAPSNGG
jgi:transposase